MQVSNYITDDCVLLISYNTIVVQNGSGQYLVSGYVLRLHGEAQMRHGGLLASKIADLP